MVGTTIRGMIMVWLCSLAVQKPGAVATVVTSKDVAVQLERLEALYEGQMQVIQNQQVQLSDLHTQLQDQAKIITGLELENQEQVSVIADQGERIVDLELRNRRQQDNILSFTASASTVRTYNEGDRVLFDSVLRQYGESYDIPTSTFTCSVGGYYLFSLAVRATSDNHMHAQIQLEGSLLVSTYSYDNEMGTNLMVTYCSAGQTVGVICHEGQGQTMHGDSNGFSVFSGTLLSLTGLD